MLIHRFAEQLRQTQPALVAVASESFVPCPLFTSFSAAQQAHIHAVYQMAAEITRQQLKPQRSFAPAFSRN